MSIPLKDVYCRKIEKQFSRNVQDCGILNSELVFVAVSGGMDSTVLAFLCETTGLNFNLLHVNYGLRADASDGDALFCRELANKLNCNFLMRDFSNDISASTANLQSVARELRYSWFAEVLSEYNSRWILTGHHRDDHAETLVHQFIRGGGPDTLTGFFHSREFVKRPLRNFTREEISKYAALKQIVWREDESNSLNKYTRNRIRHSLMPKLKEYNSGIEDALIHRAQAIHHIIQYSEQAIQKELQERIVFEGNTESVDADWIRKCSYQEFFMRSWLSSKQVTRGEIYSALQLLQKPRGELIVRDRMLRLENNLLQLLPIPVPAHVNVRPTIPFRWEGENIIIEFLSMNPSLPEQPWAMIDKAWFNDDLIMRNWRPADRFVPSGMKGSKKIGDYLTHQKVPLSERKRVLVLESKGVILAILGHRCSDKGVQIMDRKDCVAIFIRKG